MANNPRLDEVRKATQFSTTRQPAIPGGVNKKGSKHLSTWIQDLLNDDEFEANILDAKKGMVEYKGAPVKAIVQVAVAKAINGDDKAREWLAKYGFGTKLELANNPDNPITPSADMDMVKQFVMMAKDQTKQ